MLQPSFPLNRVDLGGWDLLHTLVRTPSQNDLMLPNYMFLLRFFVSQDVAT